MRVALVSLNQAWESKKQNYLACRDFIQKAKEFGAELIIFPEMTLTSFSMNIELTAESRESSETVAQFQDLAVRFQIAIVFGVVFRDGEKAVNASLLIDRSGAIKESYYKIHPFSFAGEDKAFNGGDKISFSDLGNVKIGLSICYDLRFPEIYSALGKYCDLIINIANWPAKRIDHWGTLLKARAIENQLFVIGVNRTGIDGNGLEYIKSSKVINPNGDLLQPIITDAELDIFDIDLTYIHKFRKSFSTTQDRKLAFYKSIL